MSQARRVSRVLLRLIAISRGRAIAKKLLDFEIHFQLKGG